MRDVLVEGTTWLTWDAPVWDKASPEPIAHRYTFRDADGYRRILVLAHDAEVPGTLDGLLALADPLVFPAPVIQPADVDPPDVVEPVEPVAKPGRVKASEPVSEAPAPEPEVQDAQPEPAPALADGSAQPVP